MASEWTVGRRKALDAAYHETGRRNADVANAAHAATNVWQPALQALVEVLDSRIDRYHGADHPWIPGANFKDGEIEQALEAAKGLLEAGG